MRDFLGERAARYGQDRNQPESDGSSGLSPYLHFGHLSAHQVYACGAPAMVDAAVREFVARCGLPADEFYADAFTSMAPIWPESGWADKLGSLTLELLVEIHEAPSETGRERGAYCALSGTHEAHEGDGGTFHSNMLASAPGPRRVRRSKPSLSGSLPEESMETR